VLTCHILVIRNAFELFYNEICSKTLKVYLNRNLYRSYRWDVKYQNSKCLFLFLDPKIVTKNAVGEILLKKLKFNGSRRVLRRRILRRRVLRWIILRRRILRPESSSPENSSPGKFFAGEFFALIFFCINRIILRRRVLHPDSSS
jgi:hypothetical protein